MPRRLYDNDELRETARATGLLAYWWLILVILVIAGGVVGLIWKPWVMKQETQINYASQQYIDGQKFFLLQSVEKVNALNVQIEKLKAQGPVNDGLVQALIGQRKAIIDRMYESANTIDPSFVPADAASMIARYHNQ